MNQENQTDIRSGTSFWRAVGNPPIACPPLREHIQCEVAVIGSGITGALVSHFLSRAGLGVVLIDQGEVGAGSTAASTGLLQYEIDTPLIELIGKVGEAHAVQAYRRGQKAIDELESLIGDLSGACGFERRNTLCLASSISDAVELRCEYECRRHFGFDVREIGSNQLKEVWGFDAPAALHSTEDAQVDPYSLTQLILSAGQSNGLTAYGSTTLVKARETPFGVELTCQGALLHAKAAIFCTGYFNQPWFPWDATSLHTTYASCGRSTDEIPSWSDGCLLWETARPYFYARQAPGGRAMIGGEDTPFSDDHESEKLLAEKRERLKSRFEELFSVPFEPEFLWAGTFAQTKDGLPFIGQVRGQEKIYSALGYGGNGITFSVIAARLITDLILKRPNDDAAIFRFSR